MKVERKKESSCAVEQDDSRQKLHGNSPLCGCQGHGHEHSHGGHSHDSHGHDHGFSLKAEPEEHGHDHGKGISFGKFKLIYAQLAAALVLLILSLISPWGETADLIMCIAAYVVIGGEIVWKSIRSILRGQVFDENFLMAVASIGAFCIGDYAEAVGVMLFYRVGEMFQDFAVERSRKNIRSLLDLRPDFANVIRNGETVKVSPEEVEIGEIISVKAGERVPLDGVLVSGRTSVDNSALTGESLPKSLSSGDEILSGCINLSGTIEVRTSKAFAESTVSKILDLVENATAKKSKSENFITKFARYYTPAVVLSAVLLAFVPCFFLGFSQLSVWVGRALTFLVISCPCALVISVPMSFFGGIGGASKMGVLIKGSHNVEELASAQIVVFDKTGTLTKGTFSVTEILPANGTESELLEISAVAESVSNHPIARSVALAYGKPTDGKRLSDAQEISGHGISALVDGKPVLCGNAKLMELKGIEYVPVTKAGTVVYVAREGKFLGSILISDEIKPDSKAAISALKAVGVKKTVMLTGDNRAAAERVAEELGVDEVAAELLPQDKVSRVEALLAEKTGNGKLLFVGDGINDAPVIARADVGIAMGGLGSDAAIEVADVVLMTDEPSKIASAVKQSRKTLSIVKQNIVFALAVKAVILVLGALGYASMWLAVFADVGVSVLAILNALRALSVKKHKN